VKQCELAGKLFGQLCCQNPSSLLCNEPAQVQAIAGIYLAWNRPHAPQFVNGAVPFGTLQTEINAKRPVEVGFLKNGTGHQAILYGWDQDSTGPILLVNDPQNGSGVIYYKNLLAAYVSGAWTYTWLSFG